MRTSASLLALATLFVPGTASAGAPYFAIDLGLSSPNQHEGTARIDYTTAFLTFRDANGIDWLAPVRPADATLNNVRSKFENGHEFDVAAGYAMGPVSLELEAGIKRLHNRGLELRGEDFEQLSAALTRSQLASAFDAQPLLEPSDLNSAGSLTLKTLMLNQLWELHTRAGVALFAGPGLGLTQIRAFERKRTGAAYQLTGGLRVPLRRKLNLVLKFRHFQTDVAMRIGDVALPGNPALIGVLSGVLPNVRPLSVLYRTDALVSPKLGTLSTNAVLIGMTYEFTK